LNNQAIDGQVKPGEFPFPLTSGPGESRFLTWLRNHANYMAVGGLQDYLRMVAVLVRGILINILVILPTFLIIALVFSLFYGGLLTDWCAQLAAAWIILFPILTLLTRIAGFRRSLATGSDSSVKWRDRYERSFGLVLLALLGVALFELLPLIVHYYEQFRIRHHAGGLPWKQYLAGAVAALSALSGAPAVLSTLKGAWRKLAVAPVAILAARGATRFFLA
jgi:hypothetical protein